MAIRVVLVRFSSNVGQFSADMQRLAASTKMVQATGQELVKAKQAETQAHAAASRAANQYNGSLGALGNAQKNLTATMKTGDQQLIAGAQQRLATQTQSTAAWKQNLNSMQTAESKAVQDVQKAEQAKAAAAQQAQQAMQQSVARMGQFMVIGGAILLGGAYEAVKAAAQFDNAMAAAAATSDITAEHIDLMSQQVLHLSQTLPIGADQFAKALVVAERAGYQGYSAIALLQAAAEGVVVSSGDEQKAVEGLARTMNGFGMTQANLVATNNILIASTRNGMGTYDQFANAMSQIAPLAKAENLSFSDVAATITVMSRRTQDASASGMALTRMLFALTKEGGPAEQKLIDVYNASHAVKMGSGEAVLATLGLAGTLQLIGQTTQGNAKDIEDWFGNIRMAKGAFGLLVDGGQAAIAMMNEYSDADKMATEAAIAFEEKQKSTANQVKIAENNIKAAEITLGKALLPTLGSAAKAVQALAAWFMNLSPWLQKGIALGGVLAGVILLLVGGFLMLAPGIVSAGAAFGLLAGAEATATIASVGLMSALLPILAVAAPLMLIVGMLGMAAMHAGQGAQAVQRWEDAMKQEASGTDNATNSMLNNELAHQKVLQTMGKYGLTLTKVTDLIEQGGKDSANFADVTNTVTQNMGFSNEALKQHGIVGKQADDVHKLLKQSLNGNTDAFKELKQISLEYNLTGEDQLHIISTLSHENKRHTQAAKDLAAQQNALTDATKANNAALLTTGQFAGEATDDMKKLSDQEKDVKDAINGMVDASHVFSLAMDQVKKDAKGFADTQEVFKDVVKSATDATDAAAQQQYDAYKKDFDKRMQDLQDQQMVQSNSISDQVSAYRALGNGTKETNYIVRQQGKDMTRSVKDNAKEQIEALKAGEKSLKDFQDTAKKNADAHPFGSTAADMNTFLTSLEKTGKDTKQWNDDLTYIANHGGSKDLVDQLRQMGKDGIPLVHQFSQQLAKGVQSGVDRANAAVSSMVPNEKVTFQQFQKTLHDQMQAQEDFQKNLMTLGARGMTDLMDYFAKAGPDSAQALAQAVSLNPDDPSLVSANQDAKKVAAMQADQYIKDFSTKMDVLSEVANEAGANAGNVSLDSLSKALASKGLNKEMIAGFLSTVEDQLGQLNPTLKVTLIPEIQQTTGQTLGGPGGATATAPASPTPWDQAGMTEGQWNKLSPSTRADVMANLPSTYSVTYAGRANRYGSITFFQGGAEDHIAQIASPGDFRMWAEPETGGEAYIPLGSDKRHRSTAILGTVANRFGYALTPAGGAPPGAAMTGQSAAQAPSVVVVNSSQPVSHSTTYAFNGPIQGYNLEQVQSDAQKKRRLSAVSGRRTS